MAISFPRAFPSIARMFNGGKLELTRPQSRNDLYGLVTEVINLGDPRWLGSWTTPPLSRDDKQVWEAWKDSLRGGMNQFYGYDPMQLYPKNYPTGFAGLVIAGGSTPFTGLAVDVTATTTTTIALGQLPASFAFKVGDLVGLVQSTNRQLHRVLEDVTANGSGVATITVEPTVNTTLFTASATLNLVKPVIKMVLDQESWSNDNDLQASPISFKATQGTY